MAAGAALAAAMARDAGSLAACLNGGAVASQTGAPPGGLTQVRIGQNTDGASYAGGEIERVD